MTDHEASRDADLDLDLEAETIDDLDADEGDAREVKGASAGCHPEVHKPTASMPCD